MRIYRVGSEYFTDPEIAEDYRRRLTLSPRKLKVIETVEERLPTDIAFKIYGIYDQRTGEISYSVVTNCVDLDEERINTIEIYCMTSTSLWFTVILKSRNRKELDRVIKDQGFKGYLGKSLCDLSKKSSINVHGKIIDKI